MIAMQQLKSMAIAYVINLVTSSYSQVSVTLTEGGCATPVHAKKTPCTARVGITVAQNSVAVACVVLQQDGVWNHTIGNQLFWILHRKRAKNEN